MSVFASVLVVIISLVWIASLFLSIQLSVSIFGDQKLTMKEKVNNFALFFFTVQGCIIALYFLTSFLPFDSSCFAMIDCQQARILDGIKSQRWSYGSFGLIAFVIAFFALKQTRAAKP